MLELTDFEKKLLVMVLDKTVQVASHDERKDLVGEDETRRQLYLNSLKTIRTKIHASLERS
jgi:hypothetical protein